MIHLLYGEMGCGKNFIGEQLAIRLGCPFFDGDDVIPDKMVEKIEKFKILRPTEIIKYIDSCLIPAINVKTLYGKYDLVVAQALYRKEYRDMIVRQFAPNITTIWIYAPFLTQMDRLLRREHGFAWVAYSLTTKLFFQRPDSGYKIFNDTASDLVEQFNEILKGRIDE